MLQSDDFTKQQNRYLGTPTSITYPGNTLHTPAGSPAIVAQGTRYRNGFMAAVPGYSGSLLTDGITYHPNGMAATVRHESTQPLVDTYDYDPNNGMARPSAITFQQANVSCTDPTTPVISPAASPMCPGSFGTASISSQTGASYRWTVQGGSIVSGDTTTTLSFSAGTEGTVTLSVVVTNACGAEASGTLPVPIATPTATVSGSTTINAGSSATLSVDLTGTGPWNVTWSDSFVQNNVGSSPTTRSVTPASTTMYALASVTDNSGCSGSVGGSAVVSVRPGTPNGLSAAATATPTTIHVAWSAATGATSYEVTRLSPAHPNGSPEILTVGSNSFDDAGLTSNTVYIYRVRAVTGAGTSAVYSSGYSNYDVATTKVFTTITARQTVIRAAVFMEVRDMINAMRAAAGLPPGTFSSTPQAHGLIRRVHLTEMRTALDEARTSLGMSQVPYAETTITPKVTTVKTSQITELRGGVQ